MKTTITYLLTEIRLYRYLLLGQIFYIWFNVIAPVLKSTSAFEKLQVNCSYNDHDFFFKRFVGERNSSRE